MLTASWRFSLLTSVVLLLACNSEQSQPIASLQGPSFMASQWSEWSTPVNLSTVNTVSAENQPHLSRDGLALYFNSDRPGGLGFNDIYVSRRACQDCDWEPAVNLGAAINTASIDAGPDVSNDGHYMFFHSNRDGGAGGNDLYVSYRQHTQDESDWGAPVRLGSEVNTPDDENAPSFYGNELYFTRGNSVLQQQGLYVVPAKRDGEILGPAVALSELNHDAGNDAAPEVRTDGREILYQRAGTAGGFGNADIWSATRQGANGSWSAPVNLGATINTASFEQQASLSNDGRTLIWASNRPGGSGGFDLWMSTRVPVEN